MRARHDLGGAVLWRALRVLDRSEWPQGHESCHHFSCDLQFFWCVRFLVCRCPFFGIFQHATGGILFHASIFLVSASLISCVNFFHVVFYFTLLGFVFVSVRMSGFLTIF